MEFLDMLSASQEIIHFLLDQVRLGFTVFTTSWLWSLSWATCVQFKPVHPTCLTSKFNILLLMSWSSKWSLTSGFPKKMLHTLLFFPIHSECHLLLQPLDLITLIINDDYKLHESSQSNFIYFPVTSPLFSLNIFLCILLSNTINLFSSPNVRQWNISFFINMTVGVMQLPTAIEKYELTFLCKKSCECEKPIVKLLLWVESTTCCKLLLKKRERAQSTDCWTLCHHISSTARQQSLCEVKLDPL